MQMDVMDAIIRESFCNFARANKATVKLTLHNYSNEKYSITHVSLPHDLSRGRGADTVLLW